MRGLEITHVLETLASTGDAASGGSAAALVGAVAAAVAAKVARAGGAPGQAAQAVALSQRLTRLAVTDAEALGAARAALAAVGEGGDARRDFKLGLLLDEAASIPVTLAEACADVAALAAELVDGAGDELAPDARCASWLATAAAHCAAHLVEINLAVGPDDAHLLRARAAGRSASGASEPL